MELTTPSTILALAPHTDDCEFGAGASIAKWVAEGHDVHYIAFSACQDAIPDGWPSDILEQELAQATARLGLPSTHVRVLDFEVRRFSRDRQEILQSLYDLNNELRPDLVLVPHPEDLHQDHHVVSLEGLRAFKRTSVLAYEIAWNNIQFRSSAFVAVEESHVLAKLDAVECYRSQAERPYANANFLRSQLVYRGTQVGAEYAEAFDVLRVVL